MADYKLNQRSKDEIRAFIQGFKAIVSDDWLKLFSPLELQRVLSGEKTDIDLEDLRKHTIYENGYFERHPVIRSFWQILSEFSAAEKRSFLKFTTGCPNPPLGGFEYLQPPFTIRMVSPDAVATKNDGTNVLKSLFKLNSNKLGRLPSSSTCFNLLKLPAYTKKSLLKEKISYGKFHNVIETTHCLVY
ncbi:hypothetical protein BDF20DRAFT_905697 [Mycotypha africana]|uniref:uncharacterized protein n=1 Tax=Mycotypha africana TaxID=64632 RepID=UPI0023004339|nr:uncharacterized protein BDF20DRAFT_905697 [Mycotypha africana]KAI8982004.1 hypothetical protein BDF20DRAFT_905697 [Mycotypha africana]